jgi:hypothetical protein
MIVRETGVADGVAGAVLAFTVVGVATAGVALRTGGALGVGSCRCCVAEIEGTRSTGGVVVARCLPELHGALHPMSITTLTIRTISLSLVAMPRPAG